MTKDEALKLALESLERIDLWLKARYSGIGLVGVELDALTAIKDALALTSTKCEVQPAQEPMAWITPDGEGFRIRFSPPTNDVPLGWDALYTAPPQPAQEPIKQVLDAEFNRGYKEGVRDAYAKSPQRPWVGLTDKEKKEIYRLSVYVEGAISLTEAKLKQKNT